MRNQSPSKIRRQGRKAFENGCGLSDNPYNKNNYEGGCHQDWEEGWLYACNYQDEIDQENFIKANRSAYEIPLNEFETLGELIDAIEKHKDD